MTLWGWISSHRCSWMVVYVLCCNAHSNLIVVTMSCIGIVMHSLFVNCPDVIRLPSKLSIFHGEVTILVNYGPWSILSQLFTMYFKLCFLYLLQTTTKLIQGMFFICIHAFLLHHMFNPLISARPMRLTTSLYCWGKVFWLYCADSTLLWHR